MPSNQQLIETDYFGQVPRWLYYQLKRLNVTPAEWDDIQNALGRDWAGIKLHLDNHTEVTEAHGGKEYKSYRIAWNERISPTA